MHFTEVARLCPSHALLSPFPNAKEPYRLRHFLSKLFLKKENFDMKNLAAIVLEQNDSDRQWNETTQIGMLGNSLLVVS